MAAFGCIRVMPRGRSCGGRRLCGLATIVLLEVAWAQPSAPTIATYAGNGFEGNGGNGGPATSAQLHFPMGITPVITGGAVPAGSVIIADSYNNELRVVSSNGERGCPFTRISQRTCVA